MKKKLKTSRSRRGIAMRSTTSKGASGYLDTFIAVSMRPQEVAPRSELDLARIDQRYRFWRLPAHQHVQDREGQTLNRQRTSCSSGAAQHHAHRRRPDRRHDESSSPLCRFPSRPVVGEARGLGLGRSPSRFPSGAASPVAHEVLPRLVSDVHPGGRRPEPSPAASIASADRSPRSPTARFGHRPHDHAGGAAA